MGDVPLPVTNLGEVENSTFAEDTSYTFVETDSSSNQPTSVAVNEAIRILENENVTENELTKIDSNHQLPAKATSVTTICNRAVETSNIDENDVFKVTEKRSFIQPTDYEMNSFDLCSQLPTEPESITRERDANKDSVIVGNEITHNEQFTQSRKSEVSTISK